jgi:phosphonate transport system ATP-binding protein
MALAHFPRILGLRDGAVAFDLPTAEVTPALLEQLYAERDNLPAPEQPWSPPGLPIAATCR